MKTTPIRPHLISLLLGTLAVFMIPSGLLAQGQDPAPDPPILPGDHVTLRVWREGDLTGEFLVDQHFLVTLPLIGELDVRGETELSLRERVRVLMRAELRNPSIQVFVLKRVRVLGAVIEPGIFHLGATMSVADALASAGGRTPDAQPGAVILRRGGEIMDLNVFEDARLSDLAVRTGDELLVPGKSWIERHLESVVTGLAVSAGLILAVVSK